VDRDAKYAAVAVFALLAIVAAVAFVLWYSGASERRQYVRYEIYFDGSVSGLDKGSPVRYLGVDVGRVRNLSVDLANPGRVKVLAEVDSRAPISGATQAQLGLLGLTGLLYIDLQKDPAGDPNRPLAKGEQYDVIPSRPGDIEAFLAKLPDLLARAAGVAERLDLLLADQNLEAVSETLKNMQVASRDLPVVAREAASLAGDLRRTANEVSELAASMRGVADQAGPKLEATLAASRAAMEKLGSTADSLDRIVSGNEATLAQFAGSGVGDLQQLIIDLRGTSDEMSALARSLRENPSSLLIEPKESGMEIPP
jgi:phospholipid/cholesterol/gamma-HCH transport system substrate-binding protein